MKLTLVIFGLLSALVAGASVASANHIVHKTCIVYLPVNNVITSWGSDEQRFVKKGYTPVQVNQQQLAQELSEGDLTASLHIQINEFRESCAIQFSLLKIVRFSNQLTNATLYYKNGHAHEKFYQDKIPCKKAEEAVFKDLPACVIGN